jgi:TetR/AcrR family transcriptional regulator, tetracycline repressor protein
VKGLARKAGAMVRPRADRKVTLSRAHILAVALSLIDRSGVAAFSLRELASELGVYPTAIYWHIPNRNELIAGVVELALGKVSVRLPAGNWQSRLRVIFRRFRTALRRHPKLAPVIGAELISNSPLDLAMLDHIIAALEDAGFSELSLVDAFNVVVAGMCGFATLELAAAPTHDSVAWVNAHRRRVRQFPPVEYPALARHIDRLQNKAFILRWTSGTRQPLATGFEAWIDVLISGLELRSTQLAKAALSPSI